MPRQFVSTPMDALLLCYGLFALAGREFSYEVEEESMMRVTRCPYYIGLRA